MQGSRCSNSQIKPHGAIYGQTSRSLPLARAAVRVCKIFSNAGQDIAFVGLAGTAHQQAAEELGVKFIPGTRLLLTECTPGLQSRYRMVCRSGLQSRRETADHEVIWQTLGFFPPPDPFCRVHTHVTHESVQKRVSERASTSVSFGSWRSQVNTLLQDRKVTTIDGQLLPFDMHVDEVSICCHSDTPVSFLPPRVLRIYRFHSGGRGDSDFGQRSC